MSQIHTFRSKGPNTRIVRVPRVMLENAIGRQYEAQAGLAYDFEPGDGVLEVRAGQDVLPDGPHGEEQDAVAFLRSSALFNDYFFEDGNAPEELRPTLAEVTQEVIAATAGADVVALEEIRQREVDTHGRENVLALVDGALTQLEAQTGS